jgi:hypothetical protein
MPEPTINKFLIRESMKGLQARQSFASLEELTEAVAEDLFNEGFTVGSEAKAKIAKVVEEEGYTGRFALDDVLRRKFKNKRLLPIVSVVVGLLVFVITTSASAIIEHFVQKPLEDARPAPLTAIFQVPDRADQLLRFKAQIKNTSGAPLTNIIIFASADQVAKQYPIQQLAVGESHTVSGILDLTGVDGDTIDFVAYVIVGDFSLRSHPAQVAHRNQQVAAITLDSGRTFEGQAAPSMAAESVAPTARLNGQAKPTAKMAAPSVPLKPSEDKANSPSINEAGMMSVSCDTVALDEEMQRLKQRDDPVSRQLLEAMTAAGR